MKALIVAAVVWVGPAVVLGVALTRDWWRHRDWDNHLSGCPGLDELGSRARHPSARPIPVEWECGRCGHHGTAADGSDVVAAFRVHMRLAHIPAPRGVDY